MATLIPRQPVPELEVPTLDGDHWRLSERAPKAENFTLLVFYRGQHCPICGNYLRDLDRKLDEFGRRGVQVLALSSDDQDRARQSRADWKIERLDIGYGLDLDKAREWGLFVSSGRGVTSSGFEEPPFFSEPGLFLLRPDATLYFSNIQTMPFARPDFGAILKALDFVIEKDYPARGEVEA